MFRFPIPLGLAAVAAVCGSCSETSPILNRTGEGRVTAMVGPGGGVLRGAGGTTLEGFELTIPEGALARLVAITVSDGPDIAVPGTTAQTRGVQIRVRPDPGVLRRPARIAVALGLPKTRRADDLVVVARPPVEQPTALVDPAGRLAVLADIGEYDDVAETFTFEVRSLSDFQLRAATEPRLADDSIRLVSLGFAALGRLTESSVREADVLFAEAQRADPFSPAANLFRALSRVVVVLNDRADTGPGLDSVGEALQAIGFDVDAQALIERARTGQWPRRIRVPAGAPTAADVSDFLRRRLRPAIELALRDLDRVPYSTELLLTLPDWIPGLPGERELDATDILLLRAALAGMVWTIDFAEDLMLDADAAFLTSAAGRALTLQEALDRFPTVGRLRSRPDAGTLAALAEALFALQQGFDALAAEDDDQSDDLAVFARSMTPERRDRLRSNLAQLAEAARSEVTARIVLGGGRGSLVVDLLRAYRSGAFEPRLFVPELLRFLPIAGTLPDPTLGTLLPAMTQDRAADLLGMVSRHDMPAVTIDADGAFADWTPATEALRPADRVGDVRPEQLDGLDLERVFLADSGDYLAFRLRLADGTFGFRPRQETVYGVTVRELNKGSLGRRIDVIVRMTDSGADVRVDRDGAPRSVRFLVAFRGGDLELLLNRFDLLEPDEPIRDRVVRAFSLGFDIVDGVQATDRTRPIAVRF